MKKDIYYAMIWQQDGLVKVHSFETQKEAYEFLTTGAKQGIDISRCDIAKSLGDDSNDSNEETPAPEETPPLH